MKKERNDLFAVCTVIADRVRKKLFITEETIQNIRILNCSSTKLYFVYKKRYPDFEEVIIPNLKAIPINKVI